MLIDFRKAVLVRDFVKDTPSDRGLIISGRHNYFDSDKEMREALGFFQSDFPSLILVLRDFSEEQVQLYLEKSGWRASIPTWLPTRPLLLSYLITKKLIDTVLETATQISPAVGWDALLTKVCEREALLEVGIDGPTVRRLIERLASKARRNADGLGPIPAQEILKTFQEVCHYVPDDKASILLQRLPGLGIPNEEDGARKFIDLSLADAARAGDTIRYVLSPFEPLEFINSEWQAELGDIGLQMVVMTCTTLAVTETQMTIAVREAIFRHESPILSSDLVRVVQELDYPYSDPDHLFIKDVVIHILEFGDTTYDLSKITFQDCIIRYLQLSDDINWKSMPRFKKCLFVAIDGTTSKQEMPSDVFFECIFEEFKNTGETNNAVMELSIPLPCRVMVVILRKLYLQPGAGRRTSAFYRGDPKGRQYISDILHILKQNGVVIESKMGTNTVWLPVRSQMERIRSLLVAPVASSDPLMKLAKQITD